MALSDHELATFLWEQPQECEARGLHGWHSWYSVSARRRLDLGPYGEAQQVHVRFSPRSKCYCARLVLSTAGTISAQLYRQAQRQLFALRELLFHAAQGPAFNPPYLCCVLIGQRLETTRPFRHALELDAHCFTYLYRHDATGLHFQLAPAFWDVQSNQLIPALSDLTADLCTERTDTLALYEAQRTPTLAGLAATPPTELAELAVTPTGVLAHCAAPSTTGQLSLFPTPANSPDTTTVGQRLARLAEHVGGGKVAELARVVGLAAPVLQNLTAERHTPSFETLHQVLTALPQVSPAWLVLGQGPMLTHPKTTC